MSTQPTHTAPTTAPASPATATASPASDSQSKADQLGPGEAFRQAWTDAHAGAVDVLTRAARLRIPTQLQPSRPSSSRPDGQSDTEALDTTPGTAADTGIVTASEPVDFAGFLATVLPAVAANLGGVNRLLAGRPGSWEADALEALLTGAVGPDEAWLFEHRTEPVVVPLNVLDLVWQIPGFPDVDQALLDVDERHTRLPDAEYDYAAQAAEEDALVTTYADLYAQYANDFARQVHTAAAAIPGLAAPVHVVAVHDPRPMYGITPDNTTAPPAPEPPGDPTDDLAGEQLATTPDPTTGPVVNPDQYDPTGPDLLAARLWVTAFNATPIPAPPTDVAALDEALDAATTEASR